MEAPSLIRYPFSHLSCPSVMLCRCRRLALLLAAAAAAILSAAVSADECHLTPVIHVLQFPGCTPKPIPSFACAGRCTSYVQVRD